MKARDEALQSKANYDVANGVITEIKECIKRESGLLFQVGKLLKKLRDDKLYKELGEHETWEDFIKSGDYISLAYSTVYAHIELYEVYILKHGFLIEDIVDIPWDKLRLVLPLIRKLTSREEVLELIEKVRILSRSDLKVEVLEGEIVSEGKDKVHTKVVKIFLHVCGKYRVDIDKSELCTCKEKKKK